MQTLVCSTPGSFAWENREKPVSKKGHAIIRIKRIGICGTDLHAFQGTQPFFSYPRVLGHELSGILEEVDPATGFTPGEAVTFIPYLNCGTCIACRRGKPNCCAKINVCGVHIDGGMTEYFQVPDYALIHGQGLGFDSLALVEPLAIGAHGVRRAAVEKEEFVLVIGAGPIGLGTMELARIAGAQVIAMDISESRLQFCREQLGIQHTIVAGKPDSVQQLADITGGDMATVVIDATGNLRAINEGIQYLSHGGRYVLIGLQKEAFSFSHPEFHKRESTLMSSRNATREDFDLVISSIRQGLIKPETYITHRASFNQVSAEFESWLNPATGVIKAMIEVD
ncbi:zinc-binding alcohol dehydrogenase family protein [Chitinophaga sp. sic0106]|uniref:zinc-binding alcohol dehydrogenase family protein n=1 Tax=Chitinophaga sp. sic0106 TaxID=2854785 RepID=UPI001C438A9E|nr:zinc-binding alcohol dehydrogenase family protein [Chitinophaga sp. sic0106]MBV7530250.1 zinc-binding alcohol dehydrogenase family protein [Chitinophaga sp. sic0106]